MGSKRRRSKVSVLNRELEAHFVHPASQPDDARDNSISHCASFISIKWCSGPQSHLPLFLWRKAFLYFARNWSADSKWHEPTSLSYYSLDFIAVKVSQYFQIIFKLLPTYTYLLINYMFFSSTKKGSRVLFWNVTHIDLIIIIWFYKITYFMLPNRAGLLLEFKIKKWKKK